jgi:cyclic pyranopterin phosphate synthase
VIPAPARARVFRKLRVSLTRSCNFGCVYCAHDGKAVVDARHTAADQFVGWISKIQQHAPIGKIRLTGGEPTLYPQLPQLVRALSQTTDAELSMTTNGHRLQTLAAPLRTAGLSAVNISLDAMDEAIFRSMGGRGYQQVLAVSQRRAAQACT